MTARGKGDRLTAALTGKGRELSPQESKRRNIMAVARRVTSLERRVKRLLRDLKQARKDLRFARREFKLLTSEPEMETFEGFPFGKDPRTED